MTKEEKLLLAIGEIDDELILAADSAAPETIIALLGKKQWKKIALTAACFLICAGVWFSVGDRFYMGSKSFTTSIETPNMESQDSAAIIMESDMAETVEEECAVESAAPETPKEQAEDAKLESGYVVGSGVNTDKVPYISSHTPLLPLDISGDSEDITALRTVTIDAGNYYYEDRTKAAVTDDYLLTNTSNVAKEVTIEYSYGDSLHNMAEVNMTVDGSLTDSTQSLQVSNTFTEFADDGMNLRFDYSWAAYEEILNQNWGSVDEQLPPYGDEMVTVYEIYDPVVPDNAPDAASLAIRFHCPEDTLIWNNNFNGLQQDGEERCYDVFVSEFDRYPLMSRSIWVFGVAEPLDITVKGYTDGSCETEVSGLTAKVKSYTMTLKEAISQSVQQYAVSNHLELNDVDTNTLINATLQYLKYSPLGSEPQSRYDMLLSWELYNDVLAARRLFTLKQTIVIPADSTVQISVQILESSRFVYEVAAQLGSKLNIESTVVNFTKPEQGAIVEGNLSEGETTLDLSIDRWYVICDEAVE